MSQPQPSAPPLDLDDTLNTATSTASAALAGTSAAFAGIGQKASELMSGVTPIQIILWVALAVVLAIMIWYIVYKVNQKKMKLHPLTSM